jgi:hypothetical protein
MQRHRHRHRHRQRLRGRDTETATKGEGDKSNIHKKGVSLLRKRDGYSGMIDR